MRSYAAGVVKGNTSDTIGGTVDAVNEAISPVTKPLGLYSSDPVGGSKSLRRLLGQNVEDANIAETAGSMLSVGGAAKAMIVGAARIGKANAFQEADLMAEFATGKRASPAELFQKTGVYEEKGKLKTAISDAASTVDMNMLARSSAAPLPLPAVVSHPDVYRLYPELTKLTISSEKLPGDVKGRFLPAENRVVISSKVTSPDEVRSILLHEMQHKVQDLEGFGSGGSVGAMINFNPETVKAKLEAAYNNGTPDVRAAVERFGARFNEKLREGFNRYLNLPGEQEARFTQDMRNTSADDLRTKILNMLEKGDTPATADTRPIRPIP
jgi:hypothetical protein